MKKLFILCSIMGYAFCSQAANHLKYDVKTDSVKLNKKVQKLSSKLDDLKTELLNTQNQIPVDSLKLVGALIESHEAQLKSKKKSEDAVGGNLSDVKSAEKQAKNAAKQTSEAEDAAKQLAKTRKKAKDLAEEIQKNQQKLNEAQTELTEH